MQVQIEYIKNISSKMNLKFGENWEISGKDLLKFCQKLENSVKTTVWKYYTFHSKGLLIQNASAKYKL